MKLHSLIVDEFLTQFDALRAYADTAVYAAVRNPVDAVEYPGICLKVPSDIEQEISERLSLTAGKLINVNFMFMRLSLGGVPVPHQAHDDSVMGRFSVMLYLCRSEDCRGGTELIRHVEGMDRKPANFEQEEIWGRDTNDSSKWMPYMTCEMKPNRAFIFDASLMHRAAPIGGFGDGPTNGRLVLTAFFS